MTMLLGYLGIAKDLARALLGRLHVSEEGQDLAEYLLLTFVIVAIVIAIVWGAYQGVLDDLVTRIADTISGFNPGTGGGGGGS